LRKPSVQRLSSSPSGCIHPSGWLGFTLASFALLLRGVFGPTVFHTVALFAAEGTLLWLTLSLLTLLPFQLGIPMASLLREFGNGHGKGFNVIGSGRWCASSDLRCIVAELVAKQVNVFISLWVPHILTYCCVVGT
jgi:hypothetical protein